MSTLVHLDLMGVADAMAHCQAVDALRCPSSPPQEAVLANLPAKLEKAKQFPVFG